MYDAIGRLLATEVAPASGLLRLAAAETLPVGTYLVRSGRQTLRMLRN